MGYCCYVQIFPNLQMDPQLWIIYSGPVPGLGGPPPCNLKEYRRVNVVI